VEVSKFPNDSAVSPEKFICEMVTDGVIRALAKKVLEYAD